MEVSNPQSLQTKNTHCAPAECDMFQFMAKKLGVKVLHPGGLGATETLAQKCGISRDTTLLDVGCGRGSTSIFLARQYGCRVVGVDSDQNLILEAQKTVLAKGVADRVGFREANVQSLPFENDVFDGAIVQAVLIFTEKQAVLRHVRDKIRYGGFVGIVELAWKKEPPEQVRRRAADTLCSVAVNVEEHHSWTDLIRSAGLVVECAELRDMSFSFIDMLRNEGVLSTIRMASMSLTSSEVRTKMRSISNLFKETHEYLGYGLYVGRKRRLIDRSAAFDENT